MRRALHEWGTLRARLLAVTLGEGLGFIPRGTHDPRCFVRPEELRLLAAASKNGDRQGLDAIELWHHRKLLNHITVGKHQAVCRSFAPHDHFKTL